MAHKHCHRGALQIIRGIKTKLCLISRMEGAGNPHDPVRALLFLMGLPQRRAVFEQWRGAAPAGRVQKH